jgi:TetR/AcrR family transcriptional regulator
VVRRRARRATARRPARELDAEQLVLSELALAMFPIAFPQLTRLVTGKLPTDPEFKAERRAFLERLTARLDAQV